MQCAGAVAREDGQAVNAHRRGGTAQRQDPGRRLDRCTVRNQETPTMLKVLLAAACLLWQAGAAQAQSFPDKAVRIVVPFTTGGASDSLARTVAERMAVHLKQPVLVENKPGAGTTLASSFVAKAKPDGHTVLFAASSFGIAPWLYKDVGYDPLKDFAPLSQLASITHVLVVNNEVPAKNVQEFIQWAKAHPTAVNYASVGAGTTTHLEAEVFKRMAGVEMTHVPYRGSKEALVDLVGGRVQAMFDAYTSSAPLARDGRLRILGVTTAQPSAAAPGVPTIAKEALPGFDVMTWMGLLVPAGTPADALAKLSEAVQAALADPAVQDKLKGLGFDVIGSKPEAFGAYLKKDVTSWRDFIQAQGITVQ
jgi:tripartite-type tricarboxylate transporter receptor subunit TctC